MSPGAGHLRPARPRPSAIARAYTGVDRAHVAIWLRICPFAAIVALVSAEGAVLDIACGHGHLALLLATGAPGRRVRGVDIDERKIAAAWWWRLSLDGPSPLDLGANPSLRL